MAPHSPSSWDCCPHNSQSVVVHCILCFDIFWAQYKAEYKLSTFPCCFAPNVLTPM